MYYCCGIGIQIAFILSNPLNILVMKRFFTFIGLVSMTAFFNAQIVINEVYTGGGILNALITSDFIELKNIGSTTSSLNGATIQYGPVSGSFTQYNELPNITLAPGQTYLIQQASEGQGLINLLNPNLIVNVVLNFDGSGPLLGVGINLGLTSGKIALASNATQVTGPTASNVIDFVGYGVANQFEGAGAAPSPTILNSISRVSGNDTNNNNVDFVATFPSPQGSGTTLGTSDTANAGSSKVLVRNSMVKNNQLIFARNVENMKIYSTLGQIVKTAVIKEGQSINISDLPKGAYIVTGLIDNVYVSQKILKE